MSGKKLIWVGTGFLGLFAVLLTVAPYLAPIVLGWIFGTVLKPVMNWRGLVWLRHSFRAGFVTVAFFLVFVTPLCVALFSGSRTLIEQFQRPAPAAQKASAAPTPEGGQPPKPAPTQTTAAPSGLATTAKTLAKEEPREAVEDLVENNIGVRRFIKKLPFDPERVMAWATTALEELKAAIADLARNLMVSLPVASFGLFLVLISTYGTLEAGEKIRARLLRNRLFPPAVTRRVLDAFEGASSSAVNASVFTGIIQAGIFVLISIFSGVGTPVIVGTITFFASFLPLLGTAPIFIAMAILAIVDGKMGALGWILPGALIAGIADNIVRPWFIGKHDEVSPLVTLVAIFGAVEWIGIYGLFIGPVIIVVFLHVLEELDRAGWVEAGDAAPQNPPLVDSSDGIR